MEYPALERDGLILADRISHLLDDPRSLVRDSERGLLVRLRRGAYVRRASWENAGARQQHLLRIRATVAAAVRPLLIAGESAAAVWGMPLANSWSDDVLVLDEWRGGGHREPGVRHSSVRADEATEQMIDGIRVTSLARTALDVARRSGFVEAIGSVDWSLWRKNNAAVTRSVLFDELATFGGSRCYRHLERVVDFSTALSDSFGESEARAVIHLLGFEIPELQVAFRDAQGNVFPDYFWRSVRVAGEFDGKQKYTRNDLTGGDPGEVVWREKKREDRLRRHGLSVLRILTSDVKNPRRLETLLLEAGVPRIFTPRGRR